MGPGRRHLDLGTRRYVPDRQHVHAAQHFLMQNSGLSALDRILIVVAGLALALGASLENTSRDPRRQAEKYSVHRHRKRDCRLDAGFFGVFENPGCRNRPQTVMQIHVEAGRDKRDRTLRAGDKATGHEGVKGINDDLRRSHSHGWCPLRVGRQGAS
jgi:hypothetical protein